MHSGDTLEDTYYALESGPAFGLGYIHPHVSKYASVNCTVVVTISQ